MSDEEIRSLLQQSHDEYIWDHLFTSAVDWKSGRLRDNDGLRMAKRLGVELHRPAFLDRAIEVLREENPSAVAGDIKAQPLWDDLRPMLRNLRKAVAMLGENAGDIPELIDDIVARGERDSRKSGEP